MTVLHTLHWVQFAGTEKVCVDLCNELSKEHTVYLLTNEKIKPYINENVNLVEVDFEKNRYNPFFLYQVSKILERINPDVIHIHNTKELEIIYNARFFMQKKVPIIGSRHNPIFKKKFVLADMGVAVSDETRIYTNAKRNITILTFLITSILFSVINIFLIHCNLNKNFKGQNIYILNENLNQIQ